MVVIVYPLDAITGAPSYTGRMLRETAAVFLGGATAARPLGIRSGVRPNTPADCFTLTGTTWALAKAFAGAIDAESAAEAGPYMFAINGTNTGTTAVADASNPRVDILSIQVSDNAEDSLAAASGALVYTSGIPGAIPSQPATPARAIPLLKFAVPKSGTGSPTMTWIAPMLVTPGLVPVFATATDRDAQFTNLVADDLSRLSTERFDRRWNGTAWKPRAAVGQIVPSASQITKTGTTVTVSDEGQILLTAITDLIIGTASLPLFNADFLDYDFDLRVDSAAAAATITAAIRAAGSDLNGAGTYLTRGSQSDGSTLAMVSGSSTNWPLHGNALRRGTIHFIIKSPARAVETELELTAHAFNPSVIVTDQHVTGDQSGQTAVDSLHLVFSQAVTGILTIKGRN